MADAAFHLFDLRGDGQVLIENIPKSLGVMGLTCTLSRIRELATEAGAENSCSLAQFTTIVSKLETPPPDETADLREAFAAMADHTNGVGYSPDPGLRALAMLLISNSELDLIMKEKGIVAGAAGGVSIEQFLQILR